MRFSILLSMVFILSAAVPGISYAQQKKTVAAKTEAQQAAAFVDHVVHNAIDTIEQTRTKQLSQEQARVRFRQILNDAFDLDTIARFTLGKYWRQATPAQQKEYVYLLRTVIINKYADRVLGYSGNSYKITKASSVGAKDFAVTSTIERGREAPVDFGWRLRRIGSGYKVIDLSVEGISMSVTHRSDFASVIERNGGQVEALLQSLRNKK